jgi:hypothetical protein
MFVWQPLMRVPWIHEGFGKSIHWISFPLLVVFNSFAAFAVPVNTVASLAVHSKSASFIANRGNIDWRHLVHGLQVLNSQGFIGKEAVRKQVE